MKKRYGRSIASSRAEEFLEAQLSLGLLAGEEDLEDEVAEDRDFTLSEESFSLPTAQKMSRRPS
jgi:hypothetical protein